MYSFRKHKKAKTLQKSYSLVFAEIQYTLKYRACCLLQQAFDPGTGLGNPLTRPDKVSMSSAYHKQNRRVTC